MRILLIGDLVGRPGRKTVTALLPGLKSELSIDLVVANGENSAGGFGITQRTSKEIFAAGVDVITSGNHIWDQRDILEILDTDVPILRPLNYPPDLPGKGYVTVGNVMVVNLIGRVFVGTFDCPFRAMDSLLDSVPDRPPIVIVDFHAEATAEKEAMGWYLNGRVSAVVGTHTHVPTADTRILTEGTAFVSDLGMVGTLHSVIGSEMAEVFERLLTQRPKRLRVATEGPMRFNSVLIDFDETTGNATQIVRVDREISLDD